MSRTNLKKSAAGAAVAGALAFASIGLGAGQASADDDWWWWEPPPPGHFVPSPGHVGQWTGVPPGHIGQWTGVPPGHWDKPWKWWK